MSTLVEGSDRVADVAFNDAEMTVTLRDGRRISVPLWWYPRLLEATPDQRRNWEPAAAGRGIHWPEIDEDLDVEGFLRGAKAPGAEPPA
jgi:Protein of unknown function (DUF2442)